MAKSIYVENPDDLLKELKFQTTRSSGKGGQNVNKVSSKVILLFDITNSWVLRENQKKTLLEKFPGRINKDGIFHMSASRERSQLMNKKLVIERFMNLLNEAFEPEKERKETKPTRTSKVNRIESKQQQSTKKLFRKKVNIRDFE